MIDSGLMVVLGVVLPLVAWLIAAHLSHKKEVWLRRLQMSEIRIHRGVHWAFWPPYLVILGLFAWLVGQMPLVAGIIKVFYWTFGCCSLVGGFAFAGLLTMDEMMNTYQRIQEELGQ